MKKYFIVFIFFLQLSLTFGQKWDTLIGYPGTNESFRDVIECYDKGYLVSGSYEEPSANWLIKTDINKNILWEKLITWDGTIVERSHIVQRSNGEIVLGSLVYSSSTGMWPMVTKLDSCGEKEWCRVFQDDEYNYGWFNDVLVLDNGDIIALGKLDSDDEIEIIFLYYIDTDGNLIWRQGYASQNNYPHIRETNGDGIQKYGDNYIIHGHCYYPYPSDTTHFYQRPLFIMLDSLFNELWVLPFGVSDFIIGAAYETIQLNDSEFMGIGMLRLDDNLAHSLIAYFNDEGQELGFNVIPNDAISNEISDNFLNDIEHINDTLFIASTAIIIDDEISLWADMVIDSLGTVYNKQFRSEQTTGWTTMVKTFDNKYTIGCSWDEGNGLNDIYLYKINENLEQDTIYPGNYTYDSLCPYQIQSGEIDISNCLIVTDVGEVPTPQEYLASLNTIPINAYPNPVNDSQITFSYQNTEHNQNMALRCFDVFGKQVHSEKIYQFQGESKVNVGSWKKGVYVALVYSNGKISSITKFVVQ